MRTEIALSVLLLTMPLTEAAEVDRNVLADVSRGIFQVEATSPGRMGLGTAVAIGPNLAITNCHVTRRATRIHLTRGNQRWSVDTQSADMRRDLCLLHTPGLGATPVKLGTASNLWVSQPVVALGFGSRQGLRPIQGQVGKLYRYDGSQVIQSSTAFTTGDSGGGLFDEAGNLIGVLTYIRADDSGMHFFSIPADWVAETLARAPQFSEVPSESGGQAFWYGNQTELPYFMRASIFEARRQWAELSELALKWHAAEPANPQPRLMSAEAAENLGCGDEAVVAYREALKLDPAYQQAWYGLTRLYREQNNPFEFAAAHRALATLNPQLARLVVAEASSPVHVEPLAVCAHLHIQAMAGPTSATSPNFFASTSSFRKVAVRLPGAWLLPQ